MKTRVQIDGHNIELEFRAEFVSVTYPEMSTQGICCVVARPSTRRSALDDSLSVSLRLRVPDLREPLAVCGRGTSTEEWIALFFSSEEFSNAPAPARLEVLWNSE